MAESSWPTPSNGRVVDDVQYERLGTLLGAGHGVFGDYTNPQLLYADSSGRQVKIGSDRYALVRGHVWSSGSSITTVPIAANTSGSTRQDTIVLRLSHTTYDVNLTVIQGTPGGGAPSPTLNDGSTGVWDLLLGSVSVANNASTLAAGTVTYKAPHLDMNGGRLRVPSVTEPWGLPGAAYLGMEIVAADGTVLRWNGTAYEERFGWKDWSPVVYQNMSTTRSTFGAFSVTRARYNKVGKMVWASADISITGATANGMSASLPVTAASMQNSIVGAGAIVNSGGAPTQDGIVIIGAGLDNVQPVTITTGFINTTAGANRYRFTICYESAS